MTQTIAVLSLVSIHVLAGRTTALDTSRCMDTNDHKRSQPSQQKPASSQQSRTCSTFARLVLPMRCDLWKLVTQDKKRFSPSKKVKI